MRCAAKFAPVAIWIEDNSARDGVLFGRVAKNKSIAEERESGGLQSYLRDCSLTGFKRAVLEQIDFRRQSRCAVMQIHRSPILERSTSRVFRAKPGGFFEKNDEAGARSPKIDNGNDIAAFDLSRGVADHDVWKVDCGAHSRVRRLQLEAVTLN